ncbi:ARM repeat-containing protein [Choiromyces venosus 120613-1]|uniref:MMS19 nucleotide excision repair protein n=1 Tax=Choiromyces venosus 120613-1 TaxID=1336337 RepID=A0A3N4IZ33_9PEZI|nr:ARM repeat-containing protein [Choiromyces venosus 120613-1]
MLSPRLYILNVDKDPAEASRISKESAKQIQDKELKLLDLVQSLGGYLTDDDKTTRAKAIGYLSSVLGYLDPKALSRQQVAVIAQFLCDRLEDETGLKETSRGLFALQKSSRFGKEEATLVSSAICKVDLQKHPQGTRFVVLTLIDGLMANQRDALKAMGGKFITGFTELVGGEKDPRNLMIVFSIVKVILVEFDIVQHIEILFDVVYCYFPITFKPPPDDPYGITAQDLKFRLRECIASTKYFAGHVFPQLIEKLDSTSLSVKKDVLQTITACALSYGPQTISTHSTQLWDAVKFEVLNTTEEDELATEALSAIRAIAETLSFGLKSSPPATSPLARYLSGIIKECLKLLQEPQQKQAKPAGKILSKSATASAVALSFIVEKTMPALLLIHGDADDLAKQRALMEILNLLFQSTLEIFGTWGDITAEQVLSNPLTEYTDKLFEIYSQALMGSSREEMSLRITALKGLVLLCRIRKLFQENEIGMVVQYLDQVSLEVGGKGEIKELALQGLKDISKIKPNLIMDITFPAFMAQLPDSENEVNPSKPYTATLEALAKLSLGRSVFQVLLTRLLNKLDVVLRGKSGPMYPRAILSTLLYVLQKKPESSQEDVKTYFARLVIPLLGKTIIPTTDDSSEFEDFRIMTDDSILDVTGRLFNIIIRSLGFEEQIIVSRQLIDIFVLGIPSEYIPKTHAEIVARDFKPLQQTANKEQAGCTILLTYALAGLRREVVLTALSIPELIQQNVELATRTSHSAQRMAHVYLIALLANKWMKKPGDSDLLQKITADLLESVFNSMSGVQEYDNLVGQKLQTVLWITKAIVVRGDRYGMEITERIVGLLGDKNYGPTAGKGFAVLLGDDEFITKGNYAIIRPLTKQKIFTFCVPKIVEGFRAADSTTKPNYLVALSNILRNVPSAVILPELGRLLPLLLQSLDLPDPNVKSATIETLLITVTESADAVKEHISSLSARLLNACMNREENPPRIRSAALRCLRIFPGAVRTDLLLPYRRQVIRSLMTVLDDPKRNVRKEAVDCRAKWYSLDEPED